MNSWSACPSELLSAYLVLVSRVERDLGYFGGLLSHFLDRSAAQLDTLQQGRLGGVTRHISLEEGRGRWRREGMNHASQQSTSEDTNSLFAAMLVQRYTGRPQTHIRS